MHVPVRQQHHLGRRAHAQGSPSHSSSRHSDACWLPPNPSTWIRFKRVIHTSLCASRITCKEGSSRPANMTVQKSSTLLARKCSQEIEEDINEIRTRYFFESSSATNSIKTSHQHLQFVLLKPHTAAKQQSSLNIFYSRISLITNGKPHQIDPSYNLKES